MKKDNEIHAFIADPPLGLPALSQKMLLLINRAITRAKLELDSVEMIGAYICIRDGVMLPTEAEITEAFVSLADEEVTAVMDYIAGVMDRRTAAEVETAQAPGKSQASDATPPTT
jgi:hypothetical protein